MFTFVFASREGALETWSKLILHPMSSGPIEHKVGTFLCFVIDIKVKTFLNLTGKYT